MWNRGWQRPKGKAHGLHRECSLRKLKKEMSTQRPNSTETNGQGNKDPDSVWGGAAGGLPGPEGLSLQRGSGEASSL